MLQPDHPFSRQEALPTPLSGHCIWAGTSYLRSLQSVLHTIDGTFFGCLKDGFRYHFAVSGAGVICIVKKWLMKIFFWTGLLRLFGALEEVRSEDRQLV